MDEDEPEEDVDILRSFIQGLGYPGGFFLLIAAIAACVAIFSHGINITIIASYVRGGAYLALFLFILGGLEMAAGVLFHAGPWQNRIARFAGLFLVWLVILQLV